MIHTALRLTREFHRLKQVDLANKLEVSRSYLSEIESGNKTISVALLDKYSQVFNVPASTFLLFKDSVMEPMDKAQAVRAERLLKFFEWVAQEDNDEHRKKKTRKAKVRAA
jgi:transcriptional regulator with XRE-family HTH domain